VSFADVSSRIATIQSRAYALGVMAPPASSAVAASSSGSDFASTLADVVQGAGGGTGSVGWSSGMPTGARASGADGDDLAAWAKRFTGVPYVAGGRSPKGWDCAGFTHWVAKQFGIDIPEVSWEQVKQGTPVDSLKDAKPGDLLFFHEPGGHRNDPSPLGINHVGIYLGDGKMVEAANRRADTRISDVDTAHLVRIRRIAPEGDGVAHTPTEVLGAAAVSAYSASSIAGTSAVSTASGVRDPKAQLSAQQLVSVLQDAGFSGEGLRTAWAVAMRESHGRPGALSPVNSNGTRDHGLFQLNDIPLGRRISAADVYDPAKAAAAVHRMTKGGTDWSSWGLGHSGWAGHLEQTAPQAYARINAAFQAWYDRFPGA
jgi:cell wall-associated NlpC family hydrolase